MPALGADMESGVVAEWLIAPGDAISRGDVVAVVDTDKGAIEIEAFQAGVVEELLEPVGARVPVGGPLALVRTPEDAGAEPAAVSLAEPPPMRASPGARRAARERGVALDAGDGHRPGRRGDAGRRRGGPPRRHRPRRRPTGRSRCAARPAP